MLNGLIKELGAQPPNPMVIQTLAVTQSALCENNSPCYVYTKLTFPKSWRLRK